MTIISSKLDRFKFDKMHGRKAHPNLGKPDRWMLWIMSGRAEKKSPKPADIWSYGVCNVRPEMMEQKKRQIETAVLGSRMWEGDVHRERWRDVSLWRWIRGRSRKMDGCVPSYGANALFPQRLSRAIVVRLFVIRRNSRRSGHKRMAATALQWLFLSRTRVPRRGLELAQGHRTIRSICKWIWR